MVIWRPLIRLFSPVPAITAGGILRPSTDPYLSEADLSEADLSEADLSGATMPDGSVHE